MTEESVDFQVIMARMAELRPMHSAKLDALFERRAVGRYFGQWYSGIYFIECEGVIKIGYSNDVRLRLNQIAGTIPPTIKVMALGFIQCRHEADARALEEALHEAFATLRLNRTEWFMADARLRAFIQMRAARWPAPKAKTPLEAAAV